MTSRGLREALALCGLIQDRGVAKHMRFGPVEELRFSGSAGNSDPNHATTLRNGQPDSKSRKKWPFLNDSTRRLWLDVDVGQLLCYFHQQLRIVWQTLSRGESISGRDVESEFKACKRDEKRSGDHDQPSQENKHHAQIDL